MMSIMHLFCSVAFANTEQTSDVECVLLLRINDAFNSFVASDFVTRQCLADGNWFSCPSKAPNANATVVANGFSTATTAATPAFNPGWTNYTSCYTETTLKLFKDLDYETGCPKGEVAVDSEVKVRVRVDEGELDNADS